MLLTLSGNILGILGQLCDIQQHCRMAERRWSDTTNFHAAELHCAADAEDEKSLLVCMPYHRGHDDLSRFHDPIGSEP
jgi:hypothetical protein